MGRTFSPETRAKISAAEMGKIVSPETRAKISMAGMGRRNALGHSVSAEARAKISASLMGHKPTPEARAKMSVARPWRWRGGSVAADRRQKAKRRLLGFTPLNEPFEGCEGHHVDSECIIYIPKELHRSVFHRQRDGRGMAKMNALAYEWLTKNTNTPAE